MRAGLKSAGANCPQVLASAVSRYRLDDGDFKELDVLTSLDELEAWCANIANVRRVGARAWQHSATVSVSYPEGRLNALTDLEHNSYWFRHRNEVISSVVRAFPPSGPIFDFGGGNGFVSVGLGIAGFPAVVVEPDAAGISAARSRGLPTLQAALQSLELPEGSLPAAGLFDVLEHIEDEGATMRSLHYALQPGGMLYVAVPAHGFLWSAEDDAAGHFRRYSLSRLRKVMQEAGFTTLFGTYFFRALVPAVFALRSVPSWLGVRPTAAETGMKEHTLPDNFAGRLLERSFASELRAIKAGRRVGTGSSVLVVASKSAQ